jgi:hypothetical protein
MGAGQSAPSNYKIDDRRQGKRRQRGDKERHETHTHFASSLAQSDPQETDAIPLLLLLYHLQNAAIKPQ